MARSRNIKPGFFTNESLVELPFSTRLLFIGLWTVADREGRMEDRPKRIKMALFPADDINIDAALNELQQAGFLLRYEHNGARYIQVLAFNKHQHPHRDEQQSIIPAPCLHHACTMQVSGSPPSTIEQSTVQVSGSPQPAAEQSTVPASCEHNAGTVQAPCEHDANTMQARLVSDSLKLVINLPTEDMSGLAPDAVPPPKKNGQRRTITPYLQDAEKVLQYLNEATDRNFQLRNPNGQLTSNAELVLSRLKEGYTLVQLREVVFYKSREWRDDDKMNQYLRPDTLFAKRNFEKYLGAIPPEPPP